MKYLTIPLIALLFLSCLSEKPKIYQWKGEDRKGIYAEKDLLTEWPEEGPEELWFTEGIGDGYGSPTVTDSEIFITGAQDSIALLFCLDFNGNIQWQVSLGKEWVTSYPGSRSAPTVVEDLIYVGTGMGNIFCVKRENGERLWEKKFEEDFKGIFPLFGHSEAPVIDGNKVFWTPGGKKHNVVALDRFTGELLWSHKGYSERSGYNPGSLIQLPQRNIFVTFTAYHMMGFDTETGELLWTHTQENTPLEKRKPGHGDTHSNCILYENGYIYYAAGDGNGGVKLQLTEDGTRIKEVWRNTGFDSYMGAIVKIDNYLYGSGTSKKQLKSIHAGSGEIKDSLKLGWGAVITADDLLYYYSQNGKLSLLSFDDKGKMIEISQFRIKRGTKEHFSHPVIKNGILYQRRGTTLMAFDIRKV